MMTILILSSFFVAFFATINGNAPATFFGVVGFWLLVWRVND